MSIIITIVMITNILFNNVDYHPLIYFFNFTNNGLKIQKKSEDYLNL
jgi:hypothetical protein